MSDVESGLSIGQVTARTGLSTHTLRFYEREGILVSPVQRDRNGRRVYSAGDLEWLTVCTSLRASGMSLDLIRQYAELVRQGPGNEPERLGILRRHQTQVTEGIEKLTQSLDRIRWKVAVYEERLTKGRASTLWVGPSRPSSAG